MVKKMMDNVSYRYDNGKNIPTLTKKREKNENRENRFSPIRKNEPGEDGLKKYADEPTKENLEGWDKEKTDETVVSLTSRG